MEKRVLSFLNQVVGWAKGKSDIKVVLLVGSQARGTASTKSDIDLIVLSKTPQAYIDNSAWAHNFGEIESEALEDWGLMKSLRVFYENGLEVEFGFADPSWVSEPMDAGTRHVLEAGYKILFDREGLLDKLKAHE